MPQAIAQCGEKWNKVAQFVKTRNQVQCRERWVNCLKPGICRGPWDPEEDVELREAHDTVQQMLAQREEEVRRGIKPGRLSLWPSVADALGGKRTDNACMRRWKILKA